MRFTDPARTDAVGQAAPAARADDFIVECHENAVPPFAEAALQQLYGNLFSTLAHHRVYGGRRNLNTFVVRSGDSILCLWLYERDGRVVRVLNEGIEIGEGAVRRFARHLFAADPSLCAIRFHAVQARLQHLALPHSVHNCLEDMVLTLPASATDYLAQLGKSTRSYINRYLNKLRRDHPSVRFELVEAHEIDESCIRHIIALNRARMARKGKVSINDETLAEQITHLAMECGLIGALTIDGRLIAGTINYHVRDNYFLEVIAHDPQYDAYRIGTLCCYLTICECIARGGSEYHFLWGQDEYKSRLLGRRRDLDDVVVYRSRRHMLRVPGLVLRDAFSAWERRLRLRVRALRKQGGVPGRLLHMLLTLRQRSLG